jgi:CarD family transcriptional regulator
MEYKRGDYVVHPNHGLGTVITIEEMDFNGTAPCLFYRIDFRSTTVWVPVETEKVGLRPLTSEHDLSKYREVLRKPPEYLEDDFRKRQTELEARLELGDFKGLCGVVRDLYARNQEKTLNNFDAALLKQSREALIQEWAAATNQAPVEAEKEIDALLEEAVQEVEVG